ncbi:VOC family protein [Myxococcus stipitatus]|uniref:bleomycin resistance protein n=1 Tax=Myxococcus stipitatus TaxID=83455 RepID=UPI001F1E30A1|nr:VOC family protein [Myxococcus stipitatus]MCE9673898.1 VOC family protein [Myxococcus stipitatus]
MRSDLSIPMLPCVELEPTLAFYERLGFEVTYRQQRPNPYAATRRGGAQLHFFGMKGLEPSQAFSTCLVIVDEVESLHATFADALRAAHGRLPLRGVPRITRMRPGQSRFSVVDPSGNTLIFVRRDERQGAGDGEGRGQASPLGEALALARRLRDFRNDDVAAAKVLDAALKKDASGTRLERARVLLARAELAVALGDGAAARALQGALDGLQLGVEEREALREDLRVLERIQGTG